jgi:hypothetical protein
VGTAKTDQEHNAAEPQPNSHHEGHEDFVSFALFVVKKFSQK